MRVLVVVAAGVQIGAHVLQIALLARARVVDAARTLGVELWAALLGAAWFAATLGSTHALAEQDMTTRIAGACGVVALLALATWLALPHLPAGKALSRRGIRISWRPRVSQPS